MKEAGNPAVNVPLYHLHGDTDQANSAILVKAALKKIGINATLTPQTQAGLFDVVDARSSPAKRAKIGPPGVELFNWSGFTDDPSIVLGYWATTGGINNYALYSNRTVDAINKKWAAQPTSPRHDGRFDGAIVACFGDPGLFAARELTTAPVVGISEASMLTALTLGRRFSILTTTPRNAAKLEDLVRLYGLESRCASVRASRMTVLDAHHQPAAIALVCGLVRVGLRTSKARAFSAT